MTYRLEDSVTLVDRAREWARTRADSPAFLWLRDGEIEAETQSFALLDAHARKIAAHLEERGLRGERALLMYSPGLEFVAAFLGCFYAGVAAVPLSTPRNESSASLLQALVRHAAPGLRLTDSTTLAAAWNRMECFREVEALATDRLALADGDGHAPGPIDPDDLALIQYTSGSTGSPKGVQVSHHNLMCNEAMICAAFGHDARTVFVSWLPTFHDMGLIGNVLQPLYLGVLGVLMAPVAFVQKPVRWLQAMSRYRATTSGAPNFGYDLCVERVRPDQLSGLDLSGWKVAYNGSEPVRSSTMERFATRFAAVGFRREAFYPCYGLAEASLFVTGGLPDQPFRLLHLDSAELEADRVRTAPAGDPHARPLVGCGRAWLGSRVLAVDPATRVVCEDDRVGEIWVQGDHVAQGYRALPEEGEDCFGGFLATGEGPFLRTGDLGFLRGGELFVTGRRKDLVILKGRNFYPQDLELVAGGSHAILRPDRAAAFGVESEAGERLVVALEAHGEIGEKLWSDGRTADELCREVTGAVRASLAAHFDLHASEVVLLRPAGLPRTTSGKIQRRRCRELWMQGTLPLLAPSLPSGAPARASGHGPLLHSPPPPAP